MLFLGFGAAIWEVWKISKQKPDDGLREATEWRPKRKIDPMHQFQINPLAGNLDGNPFVFTNSALWMLIVLGADLAVHARRDEAPARPRPLAGDGRGRHRLRHTRC